MKLKNNLDEMQEQKLKQIEHTGFWLFFWGIFLAMMIQIAFSAAKTSGWPRANSPYFCRSASGWPCSACATASGTGG